VVVTLVFECLFTVQLNVCCFYWMALLYFWCWEHLVLRSIHNWCVCGNLTLTSLLTGRKTPVVVQWSLLCLVFNLPVYSKLGKFPTLRL